MKIAALAGGVGGAKLVHGLAQVLTPEELTVIVNTGDDFTHLGLKISPDLDTVCYTLGGLANPVTGWGRNGESWNALQNLARLGGPDWFQIGDQDLGTHLERTRRLAAGDSLSAITRDFCAAWGIQHRIIPMTDETVATWVETHEAGWLPFQEYFVREQCKPRVKSFQFRGSESARPAPGVEEAILNADWVVICPSNPWVSIGPILAIAPLRSAVMIKPSIVVSPIVGGKALKGPAAKMFEELGIIPTALAVADHYDQQLKWSENTGLVRNSSDAEHVMVIDTIDKEYQGDINRKGIRAVATDTVMKSVQDRRRLALEILEICCTH